MTLGLGRRDHAPGLATFPNPFSTWESISISVQLTKKVMGRVGGLENLMALAQEWDLLRRFPHEKMKQWKGKLEPKLAPSPISTFFLPLWYHLILPLPLHLPFAQLGPGTFRLCSFSPACRYNFSCYLLPGSLPGARLPAPRQEVS